MGCCQTSIAIIPDDETFALIRDKTAEAALVVDNQVQNVKIAQETLKEHAKNMDDQVNDFVKENVKEIQELEAKVSGFVRENIQETLDAIKDLKLKQRVSDIIYPIFRKFFVHSLHGIIEDTYKIQEILGQGSFSVVRKAEHRQSGMARAIKIVTKNSIGDTQMIELQEETEILKELDHPNIIKILEIIEDTTKINIVTELCEGGELFDRIISCKTFSETTAANYMFQILSGLIQIHRSGFIHRDLKPENILFVNKDENFLKIIDFGISMKQGTKRKTSKCVGSAYYMSPESISGEYDFKSDVWSCGVILYIMLCGHPPFNGHSEVEIFAKISRGVFNFSGKEWAGISKEAKNLVQKMLMKDLKKRPSAEEVWNDHWVQSWHNQNNEENFISPSTLQALSKFSTTSQLQQATLSYIASNFTTNLEINELKNAFVVLDENGDGVLNISEIKNGYKTISLSSAVDVEKILENCDMDINGLISYNEFITATLNWNKVLTDKIIDSAFKAFDKDGSGKISLEEIQEFLGFENKIEGKILKIDLDKVDANGDGEIDFDEFKLMVTSSVIVIDEENN